MSSRRREILDQSLIDNQELFYEQRILDVGGKKVGKRGLFRPPYDKVKCWHYLNNDPVAKPDIICELPYITSEDASYDVILLCEVIEYVFDTMTLLQEIHRVLDKNGRLILSSPLHHEIHGDYECDYYRLTERFYKKILPLVGFEIISLQPMGGVTETILDMLRVKRALPRFILSAIVKIFPVRHGLTTGHFIVASKRALVSENV